MKNNTHIVKIKQEYPLDNGVISVNYIGVQYPETQWTGFVRGGSDSEAKFTEIGRITLKARSTHLISDIENKLLSFAKRYGVHFLHIDCYKLSEIEDSENKIINNYVYVHGKCQRFDN